MDIKNKIKGGEEQAVVKPAPVAPIINEDKKAEVAKQMAERGAAQVTNTDAAVVKAGYDKVFDILRDENAEKAKQKEHEVVEKRRNRERIFNAIGDGIAALSNLYFTTQGAPSVQYDPRGSLSARAQARWDEIDKIRDVENQKQYMRDMQKRQMELNHAIQQQREERYALQLKQQAERDAALAKNREDSLALKEAIAEQNAFLKQMGIEAANQRAAENNQRALNVAAMKANGSGGSRGSSTTPIYLGGDEVLNVPKNALSDYKNKSALYNALPDSVKAEAFQRYNLGEYVKGKQLTPTQMDVIVGEYLSHPEAEKTRDILRRLVGEQGQPTAETKKTIKGFESKKTIKGF